jgi:hypothetical protein
LFKDTTNEKTSDRTPSQKSFTNPSATIRSASFLVMPGSFPTSWWSKCQTDKSVVAPPDHPLFACSMTMNGKIVVITGALGMVLNELWGTADPRKVQRRATAGEGLRSEDVMEAILFGRTRPRNVVVRDLVMFPRGQDS